MKPVAKTIALIALACAPLSIGGTAAVAQNAASDAAQVAAGTYAVDPSHAAILARVNHLGFSYSTVRFPKFEAAFTWDPAAPEASTLSVTIDTTALDSDWEARDAHLKSPEFFNVAEYPTATFTSTSLTQVDASHARVAGDLTLLGVTKPVVLDVTLLGAGAGMMGDTRAGITAKTTIKRSDFGMTTFLPALGDEAVLTIDAEFVRQD